MLVSHLRITCIFIISTSQCQLPIVDNLHVYNNITPPHVNISPVENSCFTKKLYNKKDYTNIANLFDDLQTDAAEWISSINSKLDGE